MQIQIRNAEVNAQVEKQSIHRAIVNCPPPDTTDLQFCGQESFSLLLVSYNLQSCKTALRQNKWEITQEKMHWTDINLFLLFDSFQIFHNFSCQFTLKGCNAIKRKEPKTWPQAALGLNSFVILSNLLNSSESQFPPQ